MRIILENCNSIYSGEININENSLNMKHAINGTGKTTISKAIEAYINDKNKGSSDFINLKPFKFREDIQNNNPDIKGLDSINRVAIFNEDYINKYVFVQDEIIKDSFEIFIKNDDYEDGIQKINNLIKQIGDTFLENQELEGLTTDLSELNSCFGNAKKLSKSSVIYKGIGKGNKVENIPLRLNSYKEFIQHNENVRWLKWQMQGSDYLNISHICPYCTSEVEDKKETILSIKEEYDAKLIEHLNKVVGVVEKLKNYFTEDTYKNIMTISKSIDGLKKEQETYLLTVRQQIGLLCSKLQNVKSLSFRTLKDFKDVKSVINDLKIDLSSLNHLNSDETANKINKINDSLEHILVQSGILQGEVAQQRRRIEKTINEYSTEINDFLKYAGYKYVVSMEEDADKTYKLKLKHIDFKEGNVENARLHLSFGEKNAFALILFMFEAIKSNADLIILDDPISSFDKNKKYAVMDRLFMGRKSLKGKTVLMLTHDFDPLLDIMYHHNDRFSHLNARAYFLENIEGMLTEKEICKSDIKTFIDITMENIENVENDISKCIYLRRYMELLHNKGNGYNLLSNLFKKRETPIKKISGEEINMSPEEISDGELEIKHYISNFSYEEYLNLVKDIGKLIELFESTSSNYEKLQVYRIINQKISCSNIIRKFINEVYHIENNYIYQLNPHKYQTVPAYIIDECKKEINELKVSAL